MQAGSHSDRTSKKRPVDLIVSLGRRPRCAVHRSWLQRSWLVSLDLELLAERIQAHVHRPSPTLRLSARKQGHTLSGLAAVSQHCHRPVTGRVSPSTPLGPSSWALSVVSWSVWAAARAMDVVPLLRCTRGRGKRRIYPVPSPPPCPNLFLQPVTVSSEPPTASIDVQNNNNIRDTRRHPIRLRPRTHRRFRPTVASGRTQDPPAALAHPSINDPCLVRNTTRPAGVPSSKRL
jgi:hypothetical protein